MRSDHGMLLISARLEPIVSKVETAFNLHFKEFQEFRNASEAYPEGPPDAKGNSYRPQGEKSRDSNAKLVEQHYNEETGILLF